MLKNLFRKISEESSLDQDIEVNVPWRDSHDSMSDSVIQRSISREDYLKNKVVAKFKDGLLDLMPEEAVLQLRYDLDGMTAVNLARLDTALTVLGQATKGPLICRIYPVGDTQLALQFLWEAPIAALQSRSRGKIAVERLKTAHQHRKLSIQLQHNKDTFATSELIGFLMLFSEDAKGEWAGAVNDHRKDA